jgi:hypothetical protein
MRRLSAALLVGALALGPLAGPLAAASREQQQMMADIRMLQEQTQQLQTMLLTLTEALRTVTTRLDEQAGTNRKAFADQKLLVDTLAGDLRVVREKIDETNVRLTSLSQDVEGVRDLIPQVAAAAAVPATLPDGSPVPPAPRPPAKRRRDPRWRPRPVLPRG